MKAYRGVEAILCNHNAGTGHMVVVGLTTGFAHRRGRSLSYVFTVFFLHSCTVHLDTIKVFYLPTDAQ